MSCHKSDNPWPACSLRCFYHGHMTVVCWPRGNACEARTRGATRARAQGLLSRCAHWGGVAVVQQSLLPWKDAVPGPTRSSDVQAIGRLGALR
jgi:hypothetical protein